MGPHGRKASLFVSSDSEIVRSVSTIAPYPIAMSPETVPETTWSPTSQPEAASPRTVGNAPSGGEKAQVIERAALTPSFRTTKK